MFEEATSVEDMDAAIKKRLKKSLPQTVDRLSADYGGEEVTTLLSGVRGIKTRVAKSSRSFSEELRALRERMMRV